MALSDSEKAHLEELRRQITQRSSSEELRFATENIDLSGISLEELKALVNKYATQGLDLSTLDRENLDTDELNSIAPGAIDVNELKKKIAPVCIEKGTVSDLIDTQSGVLSVKSTIKTNVDVEDIMESKVISQGTNLQMINKAASIKAENVADKKIKSIFVEEV